MKLLDVKIQNYQSIKDSDLINFNNNMTVLAGQNESGKSSIINAMDAYEHNIDDEETLNFELSEADNMIQEISCHFLCDESQLPKIKNDLLALIQKSNSDYSEKRIDEVMNTEKLNTIKEFTLTRTFDYNKAEDKSSLKLDSKTINVIKASINKYDVEVTDGSSGQNEIVEEPYLNVDKSVNEIAQIFFLNCPEIIVFNDFASLLPDEILLSEIVNEEIKGYKAVQNIQKLLNLSFVDIAKKGDRSVESATKKESEYISANFQEDWQQKIYGNNQVNIKFDIRRDTAGESKIIFSVETKPNELLAPRKRSKGMIWFLSLWLELKAKEKERLFIMLFDEPGLHLHLKASKDMLNIFHKLCSKGHQIIYSTHSPSLIEVANLHNIGLVINDKDKGTLVEGLTSSKIDTENRKDALHPISIAMGMEPLRDFSIFKEKNVILEGLSDFWILKGFSKLLNRGLDYEFIPATGIKGDKIMPLISFCIGYGFDWLLVMDGGNNPKITQKRILEDFFGNNITECNSKVFLTDDKEIEDLFDAKEIVKIDMAYKDDSKIKASEIIGRSRKIIFAKTFYSKVERGELNEKDFKVATKKKFNKIFDWIEMNFGLIKV